MPRPYLLFDFDGTLVDSFALVMRLFNRHAARFSYREVEVGIDRFGLSAPGATVMKELGITAEHVVEAAKQLG